MTGDAKREIDKKKKEEEDSPFFSSLFTPSKTNALGYFLSERTDKFKKYPINYLIKKNDLKINFFLLYRIENEVINSSM